MGWWTLTCQGEEKEADDQEVGKVYHGGTALECLVGEDEHHAEAQNEKCRENRIAPHVEPLRLTIFCHFIFV